jgi:hypothetical protein
MGFPAAKCREGPRKISLMLASGCLNRPNRRFTGHPGPSGKEPALASYEGYCVKCRTKREFEGEKKDLPNGRAAAQGTCPVCGTKITRMLGKSA